MRPPSTARHHIVRWGRNGWEEKGGGCRSSKKNKRMGQREVLLLGSEYQRLMKNKGEANLCCGGATCGCIACIDFFFLYFKIYALLPKPLMFQNCVCLHGCVYMCVCMCSHVRTHFSSNLLHRHLCSPCVWDLSPRRFPSVSITSSTLVANE